MVTATAWNGRPDAADQPVHGHCHIAEHNQSGMMFSFNVARDREPAR